ncbi:MAG: PhzF family phenazine biosynthesis protein [Leptolinea sp.]|nr:PhzF family phenazine biosynthesis protein [Leptolinea sp.]
MRNMIYQVDAFTGVPFKGNPAGVYISFSSQPEDWMRMMAREMNLSETAFLSRRAIESEGYDLRWFTPKVEVDLCGHATLASAHILWEQGFLGVEEEARFHTRSGILTARLLDDDWISMDFPVKRVEPADVPDGLMEGLNINAARFVGSNKMDYLVELDNEEQVRQLEPDHSRLKKVNLRGVIVTARASSSEYDFVSRFFAPGAGVDEDPVTGSSHTALTPYWSKKLGKKEMIAYQASARGGMIRVVDRDERVELRGQAVTVFMAEINSAASAG